MRITLSSLAALSGMLLSLAHADDDPALHLQAFRNPDCATAANMQPTERDCQFAIDGIRDLLGGMGSDVLTCVEVSSYGGCAISLCDANSPRTTVAYAAIATAAQHIHAHCKGDYTGHTGGNALVVGFEQRGEDHSAAFVFLGPKGINPLHPPTKFKRGTKWLAPSKPEVSIIAGKDAEKGEKRQVNPSQLTPGSVSEDDMPEVVTVPGADLELRRESGDSRSYTSYLFSEIAPANQEILTTSILARWSGPQPVGHNPTQLRERVTDDSVEWTLAVYSHDNTDLSDRFIGPNVRRQVLQTFWSMWDRNLGPGWFTVAVVDTLLNRNIGHITLNGVNQNSIGSLLGAVVYAEEFF